MTNFAVVGVSGAAADVGARETKDNADAGDNSGVGCCFCFGLGFEGNDTIGFNRAFNDLLASIEIDDRANVDGIIAASVVGPNRRISMIIASEGDISIPEGVTPTPGVVGEKVSGLVRPSAIAHAISFRSSCSQ